MKSDQTNHAQEKQISTKIPIQSQSFKIISNEPEQNAEAPFIEAAPHAFTIKTSNSLNRPNKISLSHIKGMLSFIQFVLLDTSMKSAAFKRSRI